MPDSKSSNNAAWLAWSAFHAVFGSSFVSVEFFSESPEEPIAEKPQTRGESNATTTPQPSGLSQHRT